MHLHNVSGGVLGGDELHLLVDVGADAKAQVTTVGATRVHRAKPNEQTSRQETFIRLGTNSFLEYLPDPVIPYAHSRYEQRCEVHLGYGAGLIWWESFGAGRLAHGERFSFRTFTSDVAIYSGALPIALERFTLCPELHALASPARMGKFLYSATMYVCRSNHLEPWIEIESKLNGVAREISTSESVWGASALVRDGVVIRGLCCSAHRITAGLHHLWEVSKRTVWNKPALLPRKIY